LEEVSALKLKAKKEKIKWIREYFPEKEWEALEIEAELMELESTQEDARQCYVLNKKEIEILEKLLKEAYELAEPTRIP